MNFVIYNGVNTAVSIRKAALSDFDIVKMIAETTISEIYPHYYPKGAVEYFLLHHSEQNIVSDIERNRVFICLDPEQKVVGTVTVRDNEICRLFVLPECQGRGYGTEMLDYAEKQISDHYPEVTLAASWPAKRLYEKRGYKENGFHIIPAAYNDFLCYDDMVKRV